LKVLSVKKFKELAECCKQEDNYLIDEDDLRGFLDYFGDDCHMSDYSHYEMVCTHKNKKSYKNGWKFHDDI